MDFVLLQVANLARSTVLLVRCCLKKKTSSTVFSKQLFCGYSTRNILRFVYNYIITDKVVSLGNPLGVHQYSLLQT